MSRPNSPSANRKSPINRCDVLVVGAGAAGIFAAWRAAQLGADVILLEKTQRIGTKILISGGGKCNIAHDGRLEDVIRAFRPAEARFIRPSVYKLPNLEIMDMFVRRGLRIMTRPDGRVFPVDQTAKDVVAILKEYLDEVGVRLYLNTPVTKILAENGAVIGVETGEPFEKAAGYRQPIADKQQFGAKALLAEAMQIRDDLGGTGLNSSTIYADRVILASGGSSYPNSGTTGDGWPWAKQLGHKVEWIHAALAPIYLELDPFDPAKSGVAVRDIVLKARQNKKEIAKWRNDLLFTHLGVSGPTVLGISRVVAECIGSGPINLTCDLLPDTTEEEISEGLQNLAKTNPRKLILTWTETIVPERLAPELIKVAGIPLDLPFHSLERKLRNRLVTTIKNWNLGSVKAVPIEKGEVVAGGISLDEVDPNTLQSKVAENLYLCGEVLDIAGPVGGYNLQSAFATGFSAGEHAAQSLQESNELKSQIYH